MKVLFISHFREGTDWSHRAKEYALAMAESGIDLVIRDVSVSNNLTQHRDESLAFKLVQLEKKSTSECEVCIQYVLPHLLGYSSSFKNVAIFSVESASIRDMIWFRHLQIMDEVWVPNTHLKNVLEESKIGIPVKTFLQPTQITMSPSDTRVEMGDADTNFKFYYVGGMLDRDNIEPLIRCFHSEFHRSEQVSLVLAIDSAQDTTQERRDPRQTANMLNTKSSEVKDRLRIYKNPASYHKEISITEPLNKEGVSALHNSCDCFISVPHATSWSMEAVTAMAHGNTPILSACGGNLDLIDPKNSHTGSLVGGHYSVCNSTTPPFSGLETGRESWFIPDEEEVKSLMRHYYEGRDQDHKKDGTKQTKKFSRKVIGNKIKEYLNG
jgi:hypothetical protein